MHDIDAGQDGHQQAEERGEEAEESHQALAPSHVLAHPYPAVGVCDVGDGPDKEEHKGEKGEEVPEEGLVVLLHVDAVRDEEEVEGDGEPDGQHHHAHTHSDPSVCDHRLPLD